MPKFLKVTLITIGVLFSLVVVGLVAIGVLAEMNILPNTRVVAGSELPDSQRDFLVKSTGLAADEEILYFYSLGMWSIEEDGQFITDKRVVSYWAGDDGELVCCSAEYADITGVSPTFEEGWLDDSKITVTTDEDEFELYVSTEKDGDHEFHDRLVAEWRKVVPEKR